MEAAAVFSDGSALRQRRSATQQHLQANLRLRGIETGDGQTIWDAFGKKNNEANVQVNRYLWAASLDVLSFMPVQSVDPFSGVIVFGYGTPPGGGKAYRATVYIQDPALDARSLNVALAGRGGPVAAGTQRAVEDAILNRARQMRIADGKL